MGYHVKKKSLWPTFRCTSKKDSPCTYRLLESGCPNIVGLIFRIESSKGKRINCYLITFLYLMASHHLRQEHTDRFLFKTKMFCHHDHQSSGSPKWYKYNCQAPKTYFFISGLVQPWFYKILGITTSKGIPTISYCFSSYKWERTFREQSQT